jgi:hypothetical protein
MALITCSSIRAQEQVDVTFGRKIGEKVDSGLSAIAYGPERRPFRKADFKPTTPYPYLTKYQLRVTPVTHLVFEIYAHGDFPSESAIAEFVKILEAKYGRLTFPPFEEDWPLQIATLMIDERELTVMIGNKKTVFVTYQDLSVYLRDQKKRKVTGPASAGKGR